MHGLPPTSKAALMLFAGLLGLFVDSPAALAATYSLTAHGSSTLRSSPASGVDRSVVTGAAFPSAPAFPKGNCAHCHDQHASSGGSEPTPPAAEGATPFALFRSNFGANKNELCFACHETFNFTGTPDPPLAYGRYYGYLGKTIYNASTHYSSANMKWPAGAWSTLSAFPYSGGDAGNCVNCHDPHGYTDGTGLVPNLAILREENLCNTCHDGAPAAKDIKTRVTTDTYRHNVGGYSAKHLPGNLDTINAGGNIPTNKHVECEDCHNPHAAKGTLHTASANYKSPSGNLTANSGMLTNVLGAITTFSASNWTAPTSYSLGTATKEYEICFKCHAGANPNFASWGGATVLSWTNVGLEFSTANQSYHPVVAALPSTDPETNATGSNQLAAATLNNLWTPGDTMYCTDCHDTDNATAKGPHGSAVKWMLAGTNKSWPFQGTAGNGTDGTGQTAWRLDNYSTNSGTANGLFCLNCHPVVTTNWAHDRVGTKHGGTNSFEACVSCHIRIPHGGKVSRLLRPATAATLGRYAPNGNGGELAASASFQVFTSVKKAPISTYQNNPGFTDGPSCSEHTTAGETW